MYGRIGKIVAFSGKRDKLISIKFFSWFFLFMSPLFILRSIKGSQQYQKVTFAPAAIDEFIGRQMDTGRVPGLALAITLGDQVLYVKGYGTAREGQPVTPDTQFLIGSLSKSFTALAIVQLVEAGKVDLDAPVQVYLPEFTFSDPRAASQITVRQLLNQTSGLGDAGFPAMRLPQPATSAERVAGFRTARLVAQPGTEYHYFNVNYEILARIVEAANGKPFSDTLQEQIFAPLRMDNTISALTSQEAVDTARDLAQGHLNFFGLAIPAAEESGYFGGSGGVVSTVEDMSRYLVMQANGGRFEGTDLLLPEGMALLHTPPQDIDSDYAMGWIATMKGDVRVLEHNGILSTFYADMALLPESGYGIVLLYNIHSLAQASLAFPQIKDGLIEILNGREPSGEGISALSVEIIFAAVTLAGASLAMRSLLHLPRWAERARRGAIWRIAPGIVWTFVPAALVLTMPEIVLRTSGRAFGYLTLFRALPEVMTWLGLTGMLGLSNGIARIAMLARRRK